jgi:hypothetical protein
MRNALGDKFRSVHEANTSAEYGKHPKSNDSAEFKARTQSSFITFVGLATSHVCPWAGRHGSYWLVTSWVSHSRPIGCPQMTCGRTLENALKSKGISKDFDEWIAIAKDRSKWRQLTHSIPIPKPPDAWRLKDTSRENDYNCITQKGTQPSQTCSEGYIFCCYLPRWCFFVFGEY